MFVGMVGPFCTIGMLTAKNLMDLPFMQPLKSHKVLANRLIACGASVGVASIVGSPIGGSLFGIELFSNFLGSFAPTLFGGSFGACFFLVLYNYSVGNTDLFRKLGGRLDTGLAAVTPFQLPMFIGLGIVIGLAAALYGLLTVHGFYWRKKKAIGTVWYFFPFVMVLVTLTLTYPGSFGQFFSRPGLVTFRDLLVPDMREYCNAYPAGNASLKLCDWNDSHVGSLIPSLIVAALVYFVVSALTITLPLPIGLFFPGVVTGALVGRLVGEFFLWSTDPASSGAETWVSVVNPNTFALAGAGAFVAAFTQTVSPMILVIEMTDALYLFYPVAVTTIFAYYVAALFMPSIYESLAHLAGMVYMPDIVPFVGDPRWNWTAQDIMVPKPEFYLSEEDGGSDLDETEFALYVKHNLGMFDPVQSNMDAEPLDVQLDCPIFDIYAVLSVHRTKLIGVIDPETNERVGFITRNVLAKFALQKSLAHRPLLRTFLAS
jgi:H+/Cl- antiporter ClcA